MVSAIMNAIAPSTISAPMMKKAQRTPLPAPIATFNSGLRSARCSNTAPASDMNSRF